MERFAGRTVVITGSTAGIGRETALLMAAEGAEVVVSGRDRDRGLAVVAEIEDADGRARFVGCDVREDEQVRALAAEAAGDSGRFDAWINNAGTEDQVGPLGEVGDEAVDNVLRTNVKGVYSGIRHALPKMPPDGTVVNVASFVGTEVPVPIAVAYGASKAAVVSMTAAVAAGVGDDGPLVAAVCPWIVNTPMVDRLTGGDPVDKADFAAGFAPSGKLTKPEEVAQVIAGICAREIPTGPGEAVLVDAGPTVSPLSKGHQS